MKSNLNGVNRTQPPLQFEPTIQSATILYMKVSSEVAHAIPADMKKALVASPKALLKWESLTPLARNEWICWTISVKTPETRANHVRRVISELLGGKRRPCCWIGCIHRKGKKVSKSVQWVLNKQSKTK